MSSEVFSVTDYDLDDVWQLLEEYFEYGQVVVRDSRSSLTQRPGQSANRLWIARVNGAPAGCIALRSLNHHSGEVKRLFVRPDFRRQGLAAKLLSALEQYATDIGLRFLFLDSKDDFQQAIAFYKNSGYQFCERYNDNPQATVFLRKELPSARR